MVDWFENSQTALSDLYGYIQMGVKLSRKQNQWKSCILIIKIYIKVEWNVDTTINYSTVVCGSDILGFHLWSSKW